jgi:mannose-1-phosphate guanylyltransferase / mannose-6-phosphate isomerase
MPRIYQAIMCGGEGKRLWPLSRRSLPKYYIPLADGESLFQKAFRRALRTSAISDILLVTTEINKHNALKQARKIIPTFPSANLIIRPEGKETFATLACALGIMIDRGATREDVLICAPADHVVMDTKAYENTLRGAAAAASESLVVVGITPVTPSSDFGYIEYETDTREEPPYAVKRFTEKPDRAQAEAFLATGHYLWNAGFYIGSLGVYLREIRTVSSPTADIILGGSKIIATDFAKLPDSSIDYVIGEHSKDMLVVPATFDWDDYGDLESFIPTRGKVQNQAVFDGENVTICADGKLVVAVGLSHITIIDTKDALLVVHKDKTNTLSKVVNELKAQQFDAVDHHHTGYRPWGTYEIIEEAPSYTVKKLVIDPGCSSATQTHHKRAENWVILSGIAKVTLDKETKLIHTNESLYIPIGAKHRIENETAEPLILIEVQTGTYLGEDDIVRENDLYLREQPIRLTQN